MKPEILPTVMSTNMDQPELLEITPEINDFGGPTLL